MTQKLFLICSVLICSHMNAQYFGGTNDGSYISSLYGSKLNGTIGSLSVLYQGSTGDGHDAQENQLVLSASSFEIYDGSSGDGFSQSISVVTLSGNNINSMYFGNSGDGHAQDKSQAALNGEDLSILYKGNIGDGSDYDDLSSVLLQGFIASIFNGGSGDGHSISFKPNNYLSGLMLMLFNGGNGDGFAVNTLTSSFTLDVVEQLINMNVLLFPNPANNIVTIKTGNNVIITDIQLFDVSGKTFDIKLSNTNTLNVADLADGIYLLNIYSETGSVTKKLIVKK